MEYQAAVLLKRTAVEVGVSQSVAPGFEKLVDQTGNLASCEAFIDGEVPIHGFQGVITWNGGLDDRGPPVRSEEFRTIRTEKIMRDSLIEFGTMGEVVIEVVEQSASGKCQMDLPLPATGLFAWAVVSQRRIEPMCDLAPPRMGRKCSGKSGAARVGLKGKQSASADRFDFGLGQASPVIPRDGCRSDPGECGIDYPGSVCV